MSLFIGRIKGKWYHTYSDKLRDKYFGNRLSEDYIVIFTLGTGRNGGTKIRGTEMNLADYDRLMTNKKLPEIVRTESGKVVH